MNGLITHFAPLFGRILLAVIFLFSGYNKIGVFAKTAQGMVQHGVPMAKVLLVITIIIEIAGALMIIVGWRARLAASLLFLWMIPVTLLYHNFWAMPAAQQHLQQIMFMKNLGLMGGLLMLMAFGSGAMSLGKK